MTTLLIALFVAFAVGFSAWRIVVARRAPSRIIVALPRNSLAPAQPHAGAGSLFRPTFTLLAVC